MRKGKKVSLSTKFLIAGIIMVMAIVVFFMYALSHPTATSPLSPYVMRTGAVVILSVGVGLILTALSINVIKVVKRLNRKL